MNLPIIILIDGLSFAAWLFLISVGLTLIFGVLRLLNIAHGGMYAFGAYSAAYTIGAMSMHGYNAGAQLFAAAIVSLAVGALIGILIERTVLTRLYRHPESIVLFATYAVFLILEDTTKIIWGGQSLYASAPRDSLGLVTIAGLQYPVYDIAVIFMATLLGAAIWFTLRQTRLGKLVTAVVIDREMSAAMGINVARIMTGTFAIGSALGAFAGALAAPKIAVGPGIGVEVIVVAFAVVVIGGLGSIPGAMLGAILVGMVRAITAHLLPEVSVFTVYATMALVLAIRPYGLFARREARRI